MMPIQGTEPPIESKKLCKWQIGDRKCGPCWREASMVLEFHNNQTKTMDSRLLCLQHAQELTVIHQRFPDRVEAHSFSDLN